MAGIHLPHPTPGPVPLPFLPQYLLLERTQPRKTVMMKLVRTTGRIQGLDLMGGAMGCTVGGPVVGDAARRVRVKPLSRPQTRQMPPRSLTQYPYCADSLYPSHGGPWDRSSGKMGRREKPTPYGALTANGGARFPTQPLIPAVTSEI